MNSRSTQIAVVVAVVAATAVWFARRSEEAPTPGLGIAAQPAAAFAEDAVPPAAPAVAPQPISPPAESDPNIHEHNERRAFQDRLRTFFAQAPGLSREERLIKARELNRDIDQYEAAHEVAAAEALMLRTALVRESVDDEMQQRTAITALQEQYRLEGQRKLAHNTPDPQFELYKVRETEIVAEVMAMTELPAGMTREEYLRQRLQQEREQILR